MKILLAILSSSNELYQKTTKTILDAYDEMKSRFKLQCEFDIMTVLSGDKTERVENVFYVNCDDSDVASKQLAITEYLNEHDEYDVIIRTNATTVVNLNYADVIARKFLDEDVIYTTMFITYDLTNYGNRVFHHPLGSFMMFSKSLFQKYFSDTQLYNTCKDELIEFAGFLKSDKFEYWKGIPDDLILGYMLSKQNAKIELRTCSSFMIDDELDMNDMLSENLLSFRAKTKESYTEKDYKDRINIEPLLLKMAAQLMISNPIEDIEILHYLYVYNI